MTLSFREQAAIAKLSAGVRNFPSAVDDAQKLANSACKAWGHDYVTGRDGNTIWTCNECLRCGAKK